MVEKTTQVLGTTTESSSQLTTKQAPVLPTPPTAAQMEQMYAENAARKAQKKAKESSHGWKKNR